MSIEIEKLEKWIAETTEGENWLNKQKEGLIKKNKELVDREKTATGELQKATGELEKIKLDLIKSQGLVNDSLLNKPLAAALTAKGVFPILLPELTKTLTETYGLTLTEGSATGKIKVDGKDTVATLDQCVDEWAKLETSKECFKPIETTKTATAPQLKQEQTPADQKLDNIMFTAAGLTPAK